MTTSSRFHWLLLCVAAWLGSLSASAAAARINPPPLATGAEVAMAVAAFEEFTNRYLQGDYASQYELVHRRIRKFKTEKSWVSRMRKSVLNNGPLEGFEVIAIGAIEAEKIPCTEMGHCFRKDMQTVMIVLNSQYAKAGARDKEYVVMANSDDGWRFGGGSFLNRPYGETLAILDRKDERAARYKRRTVR